MSVVLPFVVRSIPVKPSSYTSIRISRLSIDIESSSSTVENIAAPLPRMFSEAAAIGSIFEKSKTGISEL